MKEGEVRREAREKKPPDAGAFVGDIALDALFGAALDRSRINELILNRRKIASA